MYDTVTAILTSPSESRLIYNKYLAKYTSANAVMDPSDAALVDSVIQIASRESKNPESTSRKIIETLHEWEKNIQQRETISLEGAKSYLSAYNILINKKQAERCRQCKEQNDKLMKTSIPISYALIGGLFFAFTCIFVTIFAIGVFEKAFLFNPWYNLMLFIGCLGITVTDISAAYEWRSMFGPKQKKRG